MSRLIQLFIIDLIQNKFLIVFGILLAFFSWGIFLIEDNASKGLLSLLNITLIIVPVTTLIFTIIYHYNSSEFIELLLSHPVKRLQLIISFFLALFSCYIFLLIAATFPPLIIYSELAQAIYFEATLLAATLVFVSFGVYIANVIKDKAKGIGIGLVVWLLLSIIYDAVILFVIFQFSDYPLELPVIILSFFNPLDLVRIVNIIHLDAAAMLGYTGALFLNWFGNFRGTLLIYFSLIIWLLFPALLSIKRFLRRDF